MTKPLLSVATALALAVVATGCTSPAGNDVVVVQPNEPLAGTLTVDWTLEGSTDPSACALSGTDVIEVSVQDPAGNELAAYQQACASFATSITLGAGDYRATAVLLDQNNVPRTTRIAVAPFPLRGNDELHVPVDFPADSFF